MTLKIKMDYNQMMNVLRELLCAIHINHPKKSIEECGGILLEMVETSVCEWAQDDAAD